MSLSLCNVGLGTKESIFCFGETEQEAETELDSELSVRGVVKYKSGKPRGEGIFGLATEVASFINNRSIMRGASKPWDAKRLLEGKFKLYQKIGGEGVMLYTKSGDHIFGFFLSLSNFYNKIREMGGRPIVLDIHFDHPFFKIAKKVSLKSLELNREHPAVQIPYLSDLEELFKSPKEFLEYCKKARLEVLWEDSLEPFEIASWYHWSSRQQNIILVQEPEMARIRRSGLEKFTVDTHPCEESICPFFDGRPLKSKAIVFDGNIEEVQQMFSEGDERFRGLKIEQSSWNMVEYKDKVYLLENQNAESVLARAEMRKMGDLPFFRLEETPIETHNLENQGGVVVLSMNQTNSFSSYTHEVLTFLFDGVNVLVYDNAGKGISRGKNSEYSMTEALRSAGEFLITKKGFAQPRILYKGQCAGGLPTSEAGKIFPHSHVWIDQAPRTFSGTAQSMFIVKSGDIKKQAESNTSLFGRVVSGASSLLPKVAPAVGFVASLALPSYDVVTNLEQNRGMQIYTIGVPDRRGFGGDQLVPPSHVEEIRAQILSKEGGLFLPMPGATHVTDWWKDRDVLESVRGALKETDMSVDPYAAQMTTGRAVIRQKYEEIFHESYDEFCLNMEDEEAVSDFNFLVHDLIEGAYEGRDTHIFDFNILDVRQEHPELELAVVNACIDAAEAGKQEKSLLHYLKYKRKNF